MTENQIAVEILHTRNKNIVLTIKFLELKNKKKGFWTSKTFHRFWRPEETYKARRGKIYLSSCRLEADFKDVNATNDCEASV